jgi:Ca2+-transporting ATPase
MGLTTFSLVNIWFALETSDPRHSIVSIDLAGNPALLKGVGLAVLVTIGAAELGILNRLLGTTNLDIEQWVICVVVSLAVLAVAELTKLLRLGVYDAPEDRRAAEPAAA